MFKHSFLAIAALLSWPLSAAASDFDYSYLEAGLVIVNPAGNSPIFGPANTNSNLNGLEVDGSYALNDSWHLIAGYEHVACCGISENVLDAGAGWNTDLTEKLDLYINGEVISTDITGPGTHSGLGVEAGVRAQLATQFEADGFVSHTDVNSNTENTIGVRALFSINRDWRLFASYSNNTDENTLIAGVRFNF